MLYTASRVDKRSLALDRAREGESAGLMARKLDTQIFWTVCLAAVFWVGIWKHEVVEDWIHRASVALSRGR